MKSFRIVGLVILVSGFQLSLASSSSDRNDSSNYLGWKDVPGCDDEDTTCGVYDQIREDFFPEYACTTPTEVGVSPSMRNAIATKNVKMLRPLLRDGVYYRDSTDFSMMSYAIRVGWKKGVSEFVKAGYDLNNPDITANEIKNGCSSNSCFQSGSGEKNLSNYIDSYEWSAFVDETPLMKAVGYGDFGIVKMIANSESIDINAQNYDKKSALDYAIGSFGTSLDFTMKRKIVQPKVVKLLVARGAKIKKKDMDKIEEILRRDRRLQKLRDMGIDTSKFGK